jgi:hypothetical protein
VCVYQCVHLCVFHSHSFLCVDCIPEERVVIEVKDEEALKLDRLSELERWRQERAKKEGKTLPTAAAAAGTTTVCNTNI